MPPLDVDSQFRFLIACIKNSTAGKVDFGEVAKECDIVTKGAAAKRYERLMKAHGITTPGGASGLKKEAKDSKDGIKPRTPKKRKLAEVDENAGDVDEPVKTEVKGEVKTEDSIAVKAEQENGGGATAATAVPGAPPVDGAAPVDQSSTSPSANAQNDDDDDDEVFVICATEKRDDGGASAYNGSGHHHTHSHSHSPAPMIPGIHSFDYAANMGFPQQMSTPTRMASSTNSLPYEFTPNPWMYPHDAHGFL
ncbi:hypothetical protein F4677DRAFT_440688 [Hypoxylon crocopeplum]|nr:hypothetical protein F4677DRAFT_440688 [Hypoxylon crocopeplum]